MENFSDFLTLIISIHQYFIANLLKLFLVAIQAKLALQAKI
jgi:hypothetical protein